MTLYKCKTCGGTALSLGHPRGCDECGAGAMFLEAVASAALPGLEREAAERIAARGEYVAKQMSAKMLEPLGDVSRKAGRIERESPLFFGQGENPTLF